MTGMVIIIPENTGDWQGRVLVVRFSGRLSRQQSGKTDYLDWISEIICRSKQ